MLMVDKDLGVFWGIL